MVDGLETARTEGTPQGSSLSPLLSNIMLDNRDKELGPWWNAGASYLNKAFKKSYCGKIGLVSLLDRFLDIRNQSRTAVYGTVRTAV